MKPVKEEYKVNFDQFMKSIDKFTLGAMLRIAREIYGVTRVKMAKITGAKPMQIYQLEIDRRSIDWPLSFKIGNYLGIPEKIVLKKIEELIAERQKNRKPISAAPVKSRAKKKSPIKFSCKTALQGE